MEKSHFVLYGNERVQKIKRWQLYFLNAERQQIIEIIFKLVLF